MSYDTYVETGFNLIESHFEIDDLERSRVVVQVNTNTTKNLFQIKKTKHSFELVTEDSIDGDGQKRDGKKDNHPKQTVTESIDTLIFGNLAMSHSYMDLISLKNLRQSLK